MKKQVLIFSTLLFFTLETQAQLKDKEIAGEYYLKGVMEVGSGFQLSEDHTFEFFFSYGAMDRSGKGTWKSEGNNIIFNSEPWPGSDFKLEKKDHRKQTGVVIQVKDKNTMILGYVGCIVSGAGNVQELQSDNDGTIVFESQTIDTISLYHQFYSDVLSVFPVKESTDNYFEFTFLPHLGTVFFNNFILTIDQQGFSGGNPLLKKDTVYQYTKSK
ncbi:MAG: hypothetical protein IPO83_11510 [Chitinophagaceae bacterium]|nr:hypothetical protein [Chitinophagaceae bacterium]